jgi:hypothetical protein
MTSSNSTVLCVSAACRVHMQLTDGSKSYSCNAPYEACRLQNRFSSALQSQYITSSEAVHNNYYAVHCLCGTLQ